MAAAQSDERLSAFFETGILRLDEANAFFLDPVRILNRSYTRFRVSPSTYYSRFFSYLHCRDENRDDARKGSRKLKGRNGKEKKKTQIINSREQMADRHHREVRLALFKAHQALLSANHQLGILRNLRKDEGECFGESLVRENGIDVVELGSVFQALFY